jgi:methionyl-tRNA synthetase
MESKFYTTTAIAYVNAAPHIGHALEFVQTDVLARYQRSLGKDVALITGADENSLKNVQAAEKLGMTTVELCNKNAAIFKEMGRRIGLSFTGFRRTSNKEGHWPGVHQLWGLCDKSGDIYKREYRGLYCVGCEAFYEESDLVGGECPEHGSRPEVVEEENYFFRLSRYQDKLEGLIESDELKVLPKSRKNEVLSFIKSGLKDFSISRSVRRAKNWGVPVPNDPAQIVYVWFDALGTYLTGVGYGTDSQEFEKFWPADAHVIGKGILRFHAVYWPAILLSAGLKLPKTVFVHGYITVEGKKMSKTLGNIVDPFYLLDRYGVDPLRYCLLSEVPTFDDGDFSEKVLIEKNNNELIANIGNLVNRTVVFVNNNFEGVVPKAKLEKDDEAYLEEQGKAFASVTSLLNEMKTKEALGEIIHFAKNGNKYFQDNAPWVLVKEDVVRAGTVLHVLLNQIKDLAVLLEPYLPSTSGKIFSQLKIEPRKWQDLGKLSLEAGHHIGKQEILFSKIDEKKIKELEAKGAKPEAAPRFADLDLEVGEIISCEKHPDAEKLFIEKVRLGDGERQIVSGLAGYYFPENLVGKKVVVVKNLKPAKLRGVESQGMLLAAEGRERVPPKPQKGAGEEQGVVEVLFADGSDVGQKVELKGEKSAPKKEIDFKHFTKIKIVVDDFKVMAEGKQLMTKSEEMTSGNIKTGTVS